MSQEKEPEFVLRLRPLTGVGWEHVAPVQRLRLALKTLLRRYGLRCTDLGEVKSSEPKGADSKPSTEPTP